MGSRRAGRGFKRFLEAVGFILAKFEPKRSHGDPIRDQNYGLGTYDMCWNIYIYGVYIYNVLYIYMEYVNIYIWIIYIYMIYRLYLYM